MIVTQKKVEIYNPVTITLEKSELYHLLNLLNPSPHQMKKVYLGGECTEEHSPNYKFLELNQRRMFNALYENIDKNLYGDWNINKTC